jgi:hypothetical protein
MTREEWDRYFGRLMLRWIEDLRRKREEGDDEPDED